MELMLNKQNNRYIKSIFILAIPVIIENILQTLLGTVDTYFAGSLNDNAIAAIGITNLIVNIFISFYTAISVGATAVVSRYVGRGDTQKTASSIKQSTFLSIIIGITVGILSLILSKPILKLTGSTQAVLDTAFPYYLIVAVPSIFLCLNLVLSSCMRATKDTKTPMFVTGIANVLNILLNFIFIKLGFGIIGLALATTLSRLIATIILLIRLSTNKIYPISIFNHFSLEKNTLFSVLKIGVPAGFEKLIMRLGQLLYNNMIIYIGMNAYVAHNIAGTIENYSYIPAMGFGVATATLVGISLGENNIEKAKKLAFLSDIVATTIMVCIGIIFFIFAPQFASLFTETKEVQMMVISVLRLIAFFQPFSALTQIFTSALQGAGSTKFPMYTTLIGIWGIRVGIGSALAIIFNLGLMGFWLGYALDITVRGIILFIRFNKCRWQKIKI